MNLDQAEKEGTLVTRPIKLTENEGNKILGRFVKVEVIPAGEGDKMGDSRVVVLELEDANFPIADDQKSGAVVQVYMPGQLDYLIAQLAGKCKPDDKPRVLITYAGVSKDVATPYGTKDVHRFTLKIVPDNK